MAEHSDVDLARSGQEQERITIAFLALAWFFILLRIWTRTCVISNFGWDDSTMVLAGMIFTIFCASTLYIEAHGGGTHITDIAQLQLLTKWVVVSEACYILSMMILKISLGIFFARIVVNRWHFLLIYVTVGVNIFSSTVAFFYVLFRCGPNLNQYIIQQLSQHCTPMLLDNIIAYQQAAFTTLTDVVFLILTVLMLWNANMDRRSKISVGFILCLGALGCICSMIRFRFVNGLAQVGFDFFWNVANISIWSTIEAGACIIAGCLATLRPLLKSAIHQARETTSVSGRLKQISRSLRFGSHSNSSTLPRSNTISMRTKTTNNGHIVATSPSDEPTFLEFLATPGEEVIALSSDIGNKRTSTDPILRQNEWPALEYPWSAEPAAHRQKNDRKRRTVYATWTLRRGAPSDGRTHGRAYPH